VDKPVDERWTACGASGITLTPEKQKADRFAAVGFLGSSTIVAALEGTAKLGNVRWARTAPNRCVE